MKIHFRIGILGAGLGSRLQDASGAKPLAKVGEHSLLELHLQRFLNVGAPEIYCALRAEQFPPETRSSLPQAPGLSYLFANTESSLHTLAELIRIGEAEHGPILFTMADTVMLPSDFERFLAFCRNLGPGESAVLATPFVDDENPLWVSADSQGRVRKFGSEPTGIVTSGMYFLQPQAMRLALLEVAAGTLKMRNFLSKLAAQGLPIKSFVVAKTIDVDHPSDLAKAAAFLKNG